MSAATQSVRELGSPYTKSTEASRQAITPSGPSTFPAPFQRFSVDSDRQDRPLTVRGGTSLREECVVRDGTTCAVAESINKLEKYIHEANDVQCVFENKRGERAVSSSSTRFTQDYARRKYAELMNVDRWAVENYSDPYTGHIVLTGRPFNDVDGWRAPVDYLDDLMASYSSVTSALRRIIGDRDSIYLTVLGGHENGYPHVHIGFWIDGAVDTADLERVVDAHVRNSDVATAEHHPYKDAIRVERVAEQHRASAPSLDSGANTPLARYLGKHLVGLENGFKAESWNAKMLAATLWASGSRQWRPSQRFNEVAKETSKQRDDDTAASEWKLVGMTRKGSDEIHPVDTNGTGGGGGPNMIEVKGLPDELDPVGGGAPQ